MPANHYKKGDWNVWCDKCGFKFKASQCLFERRFGHKTLFVCKKCYDPQHPQEFIKPLRKPMKLPVVRPRPPIIFVD